MEAKAREGDNINDDGSTKKKSKFKTFKKFFVKKKRKETLSSVKKGILKQSQSTSDVTFPDSVPADYDSEDEIGSSSSVFGSRAVSHDSVFIPEMVQETAKPVRVFSQQIVSNRIKALQLKLQVNTKAGLSPFAILTKRADDAGTSSEDDGLPRSPPEMSLIHEAAKTKFSDNHHSTFSLAGTGSEEDEQISSEHSSRSLSPEDKQLNNRKPSTGRKAHSFLSHSAGFDSPPNLHSFLDNSAAKHRLSVKPRNQRSYTNRKPSLCVLNETPIMASTEEEDENVMKDSIIEHTNENVYEMVINVNRTGVCDTPATQPINQPDILPQTLQENELQLTLEEVMIFSEEMELPRPIISLLDDTENAPELKLQNLLIVDSIDKTPESSRTVLETILCEEITTIVSKEEDIQLPLHVSEKTIQIDNKEHLELSQEKLCKRTCAAHDLGSPVPNSFSFGDSHECLQINKICSQMSVAGDILASQDDKIKNTTESTLVEKESDKLIHISGKILEKPTAEVITRKKFSVSSAWERPRTGSFTMKGNFENETLRNLKFSLPNSGMFVRERIKGDPKLSTTQAECRVSDRKKMLTDLESTSVDKAVLSNIPASQGSLPGDGDLQVVTDLQTSIKENNPFFVKLRPTSVSMRYRDGINPDSSRLKRHSTEFIPEKSGCLLISKSELLDVKTEILSPNLKNEKQNYESNFIELTHPKPPLPRKPVLQNSADTNNATKKDPSPCVSDQEMKGNKDQKMAPLRRTSFHKNPEQSNATAESVKRTESKVWKLSVRHMQRELAEKQQLTEIKAVSSDAEKQSDDRTEANLKQSFDLVQDTKAEFKEPRRRANTLSHPAQAKQSSLPAEKEDKTPKRRATQIVSGEPSWMELAKKKSQAWNDMPQKTK